MKFANAMTITILSLSLFTASLTRAESIGFIRTDTNLVWTACSADANDWTHSPIWDTYSDSDNDADFAISPLTALLTIPSGDCTFLGQSQSRCMSTHSGTTYTPNNFAAAMIEAEYQGSFSDLILSSIGHNTTTFQLMPAVNPNIDTVTVTGVIELSYSTASDMLYYNNFGSGSKIGTASAQLRYDDIEPNPGVAEIHIGNTLVWSQAIPPNFAMNVIVEMCVSPEASIPFESHAKVLKFTGGSYPTPRQLTMNATAACFMSATGYDSSAEPPEFCGLRISVQEIVEDEEEQLPPVVIYTSGE